MSAIPEPAAVVPLSLGFLMATILVRNRRREGFFPASKLTGARPDHGQVDDNAKYSAIPYQEM